MIVRLKGHCRLSWKNLVNNFNSMIVRLKETILPNHIYIFKEFQFYDSPIKSVFNYIIYRCKSNFNSMIVRLKEGLIQKRQRAFLGFQFYDSPIKRILNLTPHVLNIEISIL